MFRRCKRLTEADVAMAQQEEAMCKALYELAWEKVHESDPDPRHMPTPPARMDARYGYSARIGDGYYKRQLRRLLK